MRVVILEDSEDRLAAMRKVLARFATYDSEFFASAHSFTAHLAATGLDDIALISLDHDLDMIVEPDGSLTDPGTGVDAARWLAAHRAAATVIVHTTNSNGGDKMIELLERSDWLTQRIVPYGGESWIRQLWRKTVRDTLDQRSP